MLIKCRKEGCSGEMYFIFSSFIRTGSDVPGLLCVYIQNQETKNIDHANASQYHFENTAALRTYHFLNFFQILFSAAVSLQS